MTRLSDERLQELYLGTLQLVSEHGFEAITMDQIAEATRSSKATLYRQWSSKAGLVVAALHSVAVARHETPDTGTLRGDLLEMIDRRVRAFDSQAELIGAILHTVKSDPEMREAVRDQIMSTLRSRLTTVLDRAVARGEVDAASPGLAHAELVMMAPFILRILIDDEPVDQKYLTDYVDAVILPALGVTP